MMFQFAIGVSVAVCGIVTGDISHPQAPFEELSVSSPNNQNSSERVVLDGAKNPELFPEWYVWEMVFKKVARGAAHPKTPLHQELGISERELILLEQERGLFENYEKDLEQKLRNTSAALKAKGTSEDEVRNATHEHNMEYRFKILDARDRVIRALSAESNTALRAWINRELIGTKVYLTGRAAKVFHMPW